MPIKIMTWNVWYHERVDSLVKFIKKINPDVLCCQELTVNFEANPSVDVPEKIAKECGYEYHFEPMTLYGTEGMTIQMGNGIFTKFPMKDKRMVYIQKADPHVKSYETENRSYVEAILDINGEPLTVGTVHMSYAKEFEMTDKKLAELDKLLEAVSGHHERYILTGDMNAMPDSKIIKELEKLFIHADPNTDRPTWTTKPFSYQGFEANTLDWRLDYIFATEDINVLSNRILNTPYSDHLPVIAEIDF